MCSEVVPAGVAAKPRKHEDNLQRFGLSSPGGTEIVFSVNFTSVAGIKVGRRVQKLF